MKKTIAATILALATLSVFSSAAFANKCDYNVNVRSYVGSSVWLNQLGYRYPDDPFGAMWWGFGGDATLDNSMDVYTASETNITLDCDKQAYILSLDYNCTGADGIKRNYVKVTEKIQGGHTNNAYVIINECDAGLIYSEDSWPLVAYTGDSLTKQQLPVPGGGVSECLTLAQAGTILSNSVAGVGWQTDGNLVVYVNGSPIWASNTNGNADALCFQSDGNLVTYKNGLPTWSTGTQNSGQTLNLQVDCNLVIVDAGGNYKWGSQATCGSTEDASPLNADTEDSLTKQRLPVPGGGVSECLTLALAGTILSNSVAGVGWQTDGNLVVYVHGSPIWASNTNDNGDKLCFYGDGDLVISKNGQPTWSTGTVPYGQTLKLQTDCNLVVANGSGNYLWGSGATCN